MRLLFVLLLINSITVAYGSHQKTTTQAAPQYGQIPQDLANALVQMAYTSHTPLIAELTQPMPKINVQPGAGLTPSALNVIVKQAPGYEWKMEGTAVHFYNRRLRTARFNFLNRTFPRFTVPPNLSDFKLWFPGRATGLLEGLTGEGGATSGFPDTLLSKDKLERATLNNVNPLQVLIHIANDSPNFYAVLVFPNSHPTKEQARKGVAWYWGSLREKPGPIYTQSPSRVPRP
jgi:hypothetical protein